MSTSSSESKTNESFMKICLRFISGYEHKIELTNEEFDVFRIEDVKQRIYENPEFWTKDENEFENKNSLEYKPFVCSQQFIRSGIELENDVLISSLELTEEEKENNEIQINILIGSYPLIIYPFEFVSKLTFERISDFRYYFYHRHIVECVMFKFDINKNIWVSHKNEFHKMKELKTTFFESYHYPYLYYFPSYSEYNIYKFNIHNNEWGQIYIPFKSRGYYRIKHKNFIYFFGGVDDFRALKSVNRFLFDDENWESMSESPYPINPSFYLKLTKTDSEAIIAEKTNLNGVDFIPKQKYNFDLNKWFTYNQTDETWTEYNN